MSHQPEDHPLLPASTAPLSSRSDALVLLREAPRSTAPAEIIQESMSLITKRTEETVGYGAALVALNMGLNSFLQLGVHAALVALVVLCVGVMSVHEVAGTILMVTGGALVVGGSMLLSLTVQTGAMGGYQLLWLKMLRQKSVSLDDVKHVRPFLLPLVSTTLLQALVFLAGFAAFIVPGVVLATSTSLAPFFVLDHGMSAREALVASHRATRGRRLQLFGLLCLLTMANILGLLACGLGLFVSYPLSLGALATFYRRIIEPGERYELSCAPDQMALDQA